ncbi:GPN-loop GTPase [Gorgonomyces haynaldii]|nr:GPN-loop GTPase [Gorgonomyces haynaldii]
MPFGQLIVGPPGSGKTTFTHALSQFYRITKRDVCIVNLDPANDNIPYKPDIDIMDLISLEDTMETLGLGPNGGLIYCIEYLEANFDWLLDQLKQHKDKYFLFDCPGQVELFTNHDALKNCIQKLVSLDYRLCCVHLIDAHYCVDPARYVSMLVLSLKTMLQLELPHVNILSKVDNMELYGKLHFPLEYYTQVQDLSYLLGLLDQDPFTKKYMRLSKALCDLVEEFGLVGFSTLCVDDKESVIHVARTIDKANGYIYGGLDQGNESLFSVAEKFMDPDQYAREIAERFLDMEEDTLEEE